MKKFTLIPRWVLFTLLLNVCWISACKKMDMSEPGALVPRTVDQDPSLPSLSINGTILHVETHGNPYAHLVLRGGMDRPNYHVEDIMIAKKYLEAAKVSNPAIVIDASHDNCKVDGVKDPIQQLNVAHEVLYALKLYPHLRKLVKGFMFESFLKSGCQKLEKLTAESVDKAGLSITDPCLSWEQSEELLETIAKEHGKMMNE